MRTHIFNKTKCTTKLVHYDTRTLLFCLRLLMSFWIKDTRTPLFCLRLLKSRLLASAKVALDKRPYKISSKAMHRVCCFHWCRHVISWTADVWSELVSLVSCILPPLPRFRAVTCYRPLCLQTRYMWKWLTSVKLMFIGLTNFFDPSGPAVYFRHGNSLKCANVHEQ